MLLSLVAGPGSDIHQDEGVPDEVALNQLVDGCFGAEAGSVVNLQQVELALVVEHEVKAEDLEAHVVRRVVGLGHAVLVLQVRLSCYNCLHYCVLDSSPVLMGRQSHRLERLEKLSQGLLVSVTEVVK